MQPPTRNSLTDQTRIQIDWVAPDDGGSAITDFVIVVRQQDGTTYTTELSNCDGSNTSIVTDTECEIPISILKDAPFSLVWGGSIWSKVTAVNYYGASLISDAGNGAIILRVPDSPVSLANNPAITSAS